LPLLNPARPAIWYGGDYNPEQWPEEVWAEDMRLMREAGVNLATVAVFAWSRLEPRAGEYDFAWLDRVLDLLNANGIGVCLATATAAPPPWFTKAHPESVPVKADGTRHTYGSRQCYSPASRAYREAAAALAGRMAERYARHPAVVAWHINNELGCHVAECHGEESTQGFRDWLRRRYGTLDALNDTWGTLFWSQRYSEWDEINTPRQTPYLPNGAQSLDFRRYSSDLLLEIYRAELAEVRRHSDLPATTNLMGFHRPCDYFSWSADLDFSSWDAYPEPNDRFGGALSAAFNHDLMRGVKPDRPFLLMEQAVASTNWNACGMTKPAGRMRALSYQALARGADGILFFQWRTSRSGMEKFLPGIVPHGGTAHSRVWREVCGLGAELARLGELTGASTRNRVALIVSWPNRWAAEQPGKPQGFDYQAELLAYYEAFWSRGIGVDIVPPDAELDGYALVAAPCLYQLSAAHAESLRAYVAGGGCLVLGCFSGVVDESERAHLGGYPGGLRDVMGLHVEEWYALPPNREEMAVLRGSSLKLRHWMEAVHPLTAEVVGSYESGPLAGRSLAFKNKHGRGTTWYLGAMPATGEALGAWIAGALDEAGVKAEVCVPVGVEAVWREQPGRRYLFLINHKEAAAEVDLGTFAGEDLLTGERVSGQFSLEPAAVSILRSSSTLPLKFAGR